MSPIVGGGLAGLSAAIELADRGFDVVLLEAREVGWGASGRNGGQAIAGLACDQDVIESQLGLEAARSVWDMTLEAIRLIARAHRALRHRLRLARRLPEPGGERSARRGELRAWHEHMRSAYGYETTLDRAGRDARSWIASPRFHSGVHDPASGHLHPLKYSLGLARAAGGLGVRLLREHARACARTRRRRRGCAPPQGTVRASHVLLAGNVYLQGLAPALEQPHHAGRHLHRLPPRAGPGTRARADPVGRGGLRHQLRARLLPAHRRRPHALRRPRQLLHRDADEPRRQHAAAHGRTFPQLRNTPVEYAWGGFVDISMNRAPDFGRLSDRLDGAARREHANVYYLQGFSGHGLALTGLAGKLVAEAIAGDAERFDTFARMRHRRFPGGRLLRTPALVAGMAYYRLRDML